MTNREAFEAWLTPRRGKICPPHPEDYWEVWQAALASERAKQAEPVAWMVGNDPMTAATYNAGDKEKAFDAAKRWNWPITGLSVIAGAPDFDINYQQTKPVGEWRMKNGEPMHVLWRARYKPQLGDKLYAAPPAVQGEPVALVVQANEIDDEGRPTHERDVDYNQADIDQLPVGTKLYAAPPQPAQTEPVVRPLGYIIMFMGAPASEIFPTESDAIIELDRRSAQYPDADKRSVGAVYGAPPQPASQDVAELVKLLAHVYDNLNDMPISEAWAKKTAERIYAALAKWKGKV